MKRDPKARPGELRAAWSTAKKHGSYKDRRGDLVYAYGDGCSRADSHLLHGVLTMVQWRACRLPGEPAYDPSFLDELEARGYDITTLRFSVEKRAPEPA